MLTELYRADEACHLDLSFQAEPNGAAETPVSSFSDYAKSMVRISAPVTSARVAGETSTFVRPPTPCTSAATALDAGASFELLQPYYQARQKQTGLVLGYGLIAAQKIEQGTKRLASVLARFRHPACLR